LGCASFIHKLLALEKLVFSVASREMMAIPRLLAKFILARG
jgi:hypothetical protein